MECCSDDEDDVDVWVWAMHSGAGRSLAAVLPLPEFTYLLDRA